ncbi:MAG: FtsX-like permease family protein [Treponema sp.]|nr:FtsX-like permease family protein [Treponema sp.]
MTRSSFYMKMITSSLLRRRSRMLVALLAIAIGSTVLSGLVTIYYDVPRQMGKEMRSYGANMLFVSTSTLSYTKDEMEKAKTLIASENLVGFTPFKYQNVRVNNQPFLVAGTDFVEVRKTSPFWYVSGHFPDEVKKSEKKGIEVLMGQQVASVIGAVEGDEVKITGISQAGKNFEKKVRISGILQTGGNEEDCIYMNLSDLEKTTGLYGLVDVVECSVSANAEELQEYAKKINNEVPEIKPEIVKRLASSEGTVLNKLQALVYIVTLVVLILTMVCVATTMMAVVAERRKEIGLKKALGAGNQEIVWEFLGEGLFLGALGGFLGVILGFFFAQAVSINVFSRSISFSPIIAPLTIIVSIVVTGLACLIPVKSTTEIDPALVLKGE